MPPTEPLAVFHLAEEGAFSEGLVQAARVPSIYESACRRAEKQRNGVRRDAAIDAHQLKHLLPDFDGNRVRSIHLAVAEGPRIARI